MSITINEVYSKVQEYLKENNIVLTELSDLEYMRNIIMEEFMSNNIVFYSKDYNHKLYPIISLAFSPPKINWKYCAHYNC